MKIVSGLAAALLIFSCSPVYLPNARNVPMLSKAGEVQGHISFFSGYNAQAAVAVTSNIAIMGGGMYYDNKSSLNNRVNRYSFAEFGVGYFKNSEKFYFDIFGGYGSGKSSSTDSAFTIHPVLPSGNDIHLTSASYNRYFIQPSFGFKHKHFEGALSYRFSLLDFNTGVYKGAPINLNRSQVLFLEPAVVARFPFENFVISAQMGIATPVNKADLYFDYVPVTISTGFGFRINYKPVE